MLFSALHWAVSSSNTNAVGPLLKSGASLEITNGKGQNALDLAEERRNKYISHKLKEDNLRRGVGKPGFIKNIMSNGVC